MWDFLFVFSSNFRLPDCSLVTVIYLVERYRYSGCSYRFLSADSLRAQNKVAEADDFPFLAPFPAPGVYRYRYWYVFKSYGNFNFFGEYTVPVLRFDNSLLVCH